MFAALSLKPLDDAIDRAGSWWRWMLSGLPQNQVLDRTKVASDQAA